MVRARKARAKALRAMVVQVIVAAPLHEIVYASAATAELGSEELAELIERARRNKAKPDIRGILLYVAGSFLKVLEGPRDAVEGLFARITRDSRHQDTLVLRRGPIEARSFADWRMGLVELSARELRGIEGLSPFLQGGALHLGPDSDGEAIRKVLVAFRAGRYRRHVA